MIPQKMKSLAVFDTEGVDLSIMQDIQVDVRQISRCGETLFQKTYTPLILPGNAFGIVIPKEDAAKLQNDNSVAVQLLATYPSGYGSYSNTLYVGVDELIREGTYGE